MNELHKYATFSVDLTGKPIKINSTFSMGRARIFYKGINRNRSIIDENVAEQLASTIPGTPVIGTYNYETNDFEGHEQNPSAYGFIPLEPNYTWVEDNGKTYLEVDVVIWDGRFEEAEGILSNEKSLSMELNPKTMKGTFERINDKTYYKITYAEFAGITILGEDVEPCFEDAKFYNTFSRMVSEYAAYIENKQENNEGGKNIMDNITEIVEPEVTTEEVVETEAVETEPTIEETPEVVETEEVTEVVETETVETVEAPEAEGDFACGDKDKHEASEKDDETCPECGKNPCVCKSSKDEESDKDDDKDDKDDDKEEDYEAKYTALLADYESLENKYNDTLNSLNTYTRKEKLEIITKFSTKIESEELIEKLTNDVDTYSIDDIKNELGKAIVEQMSTQDDAEESSDTNFSLNININDNNLGNSAWDLVKRHKANK